MRHQCKVMEHFFESDLYPDGFGIFEGIPEAHTFANKVSKFQRWLYDRHGKIPVAFWQFLKALRIVPSTMFLRKKGVTVLQLAGALLDTRFPYDSEKARSAGEFIARQILIEDYPLLNKGSFALADYHMARIINGEIYLKRRKVNQSRQRGL